MEVLGYKKKSKTELLYAIDCCVSISQVCALIQHEGIVLLMESSPIASGAPKKRMDVTDYSLNKSSLDRLKDRVKAAVEKTR